MEDLKDLIINTLDAQGTLGDIRAQLRMLVFKSIDNEGKQVPYDKTPAMQLAESDQGRLCVELLRDFFSYFKLNLSLNVLLPETRVTDEMSPEKLRDLLGFRPEPGSPILFQILDKIGEPDSVQPVKPLPVQGKGKPGAFEVAELAKPAPAAREANLGPSGMLPIATQVKPGAAGKQPPKEEEKEVFQPGRGQPGKDLTVGIQGESTVFQPGMSRAAAQTNPSPSFNFPSGKEQPQKQPDPPKPQPQKQPDPPKPQPQKQPDPPKPQPQKQPDPPKPQPQKQPDPPKPQPQKQPDSPVIKPSEIAQIPPFKPGPGKQSSASQNPLDSLSASASMQTSTQVSAQLPDLKKAPPKLAPLKEPAPAAKAGGKRMVLDEDDTNEPEKERLRDIGRTLDQMQRADKLGKQVDIKSSPQDFGFSQSGEDIEEDIEEGSMEIITDKVRPKKEELDSDADPSFNSDMLNSFDHFEEAEPQQRRR